MGIGACGGGVPMLHPAHVLPKGSATVGIGLSGQPVLRSLPHTADTDEGQAEAVLQDRTVAPAIAPWVGARVGLAGFNEAGLAYSGRAVRLDGRHAFKLTRTVALSAGLGGEVILTGRPDDGAREPTTFAGGGFDVPVIVGWNSAGGIYSVWGGPRGGVSWVEGTVAGAVVNDPSTPPALPISGQHVRAGLVAGLRVGFRYVHVAMELSGDWHHVTGTVGDTQVTLNQFTLTPAGALLISF
jgi:hypothetical protein